MKENKNRRTQRAVRWHRKSVAHFKMVLSEADNNWWGLQMYGFRGAAVQRAFERRYLTGLISKVGESICKIRK